MPGQVERLPCYNWPISWMLIYVTIGHAILLGRLHSDTRFKIKHLGSISAVLIVTPQARNLIPDSLVW
ncbi:hypothetical protein F4604DRAFT_1774132 [Suillus subluteus]|nr:hypothetical protein F4604DRAFT_1774132 [Suillus subluteus]